MRHKLLMHRPTQKTPCQDEEKTMRIFETPPLPEYDWYLRQSRDTSITFLAGKPIESRFLLMRIIAACKTVATKLLQNAFGGARRKKVG